MVLPSFSARPFAHLTVPYFFGAGFALFCATRSTSDLLRRFDPEYHHDRPIPASFQTREYGPQVANITVLVASGIPEKKLNS